MIPLYLLPGLACESGLGPSRDIEPRVLEVEVALDPVHDVVVDRARVAKAEEGAPLRLEQLAPQPLVADRPLLDRPVVLVVQTGPEPVAAEA